MSEHGTTGGGHAKRRRFKTSHVILLLVLGAAGLWSLGAALHAGERGGPSRHEARFGGWHHGHGYYPGRRFRCRRLYYRGFVLGDWRARRMFNRFCTYRFGYRYRYGHSY